MLPSGISGSGAPVFSKSSIRLNWKSCFAIPYRKIWMCIQYQEIGAGRACIRKFAIGQFSEILYREVIDQNRLYRGNLGTHTNLMYRHIVKRGHLDNYNVSVATSGSFLARDFISFLAQKVSEEVWGG